jgi:hypothetical protein
VEIAGDYFGDAVNVAARLLDHAGDNETLATSCVFEGLPQAMRDQFRSLDKMQLRGRIEPVQVFLHDTHRSFDSHTTAYVEIDNPTQDPEGIRLIWSNLNRIFSPGNLPVVLGRSPQATTSAQSRLVAAATGRTMAHPRSFREQRRKSATTRNCCLLKARRCVDDSRAAVYSSLVLHFHASAAVTS